MRRTILLSSFALFAVSAANDACAQRRGGAGPGFARGGYGFSRAQAVSPYGFGYAYLPYDSGAAYAYAPPAGSFRSAATPVRSAACVARRRAAGASCGHRLQMARSRRGFSPLRTLDNLRVRATGLCHCPQGRFDPLRRSRRRL
jgi:hypothetical protein